MPAKANNLQLDSGSVSFGSLLLLEDDRTLRRTLTKVLRCYSDSLHVCETIGEARDILSRIEPELIIADYRLPDGTLVELNQSIKSGTEIVAISALATAEESFHLAKLGVSEFLTKPFGLEKIEKVLEKIYARRSGQKSLVIKTFGGLRLEHNEVELTFRKKPPYKLLSMLKIILAYGGVNVPVYKICDCLWEESDGDVAEAKFHTSLHRLRKLIGPATIVQKNNTVSLNADLVEADIWFLDQFNLTARIKGSGKTDLDWSQHFLQPWLPEDDSSWLIEPRLKYQRMAQSLVHA